MEIKQFSFSSLPELVFGSGSMAKLPSAIKKYGNTALFITGGISLEKSGKFDEIKKLCDAASIEHMTYKVAGEPSPQIIDEAVNIFRKKKISCVVSVGGGSSLDAGKAISAMLTAEGSVKDYLEGVGTKSHPGSKVPFIAMPTTSGTGSEATKNSVISEVGPNGFKRSLRHDNFMPNIAIIDPDLSATLPPATTAHCALDAISQLIESYISTKANVISDSLALPALKLAMDSIVPLCTENPNDISLRTNMSYAAYISGLNLANAGLGIIHGIAGPLGGLFKVPHGIVCANILPPAIKVTVEKIFADEKNHRVTIAKLAGLGRHVTKADMADRESCDALVSVLQGWMKTLAIPDFTSFAIDSEGAAAIAAVSDCKNSPVQLDGNEIANIIKERIR